MMTMTIVTSGLLARTTPVLIWRSNYFANYYDNDDDDDDDGLDNNDDDDGLDSNDNDDDDDFDCLESLLARTTPVLIWQSNYDGYDNCYDKTMMRMT